MSNKSMNTIAKGAFILLIGAIFGKILSFIYRIILARLGEQAYGEFSLALALFGFLSIISILGLDTGTLKFISVFKTESNKEKIKGTFFFSSKVILITSIILAITLFFLSDWIALTFFHSVRLGLLLKIFAIALPFEGLRSIICPTLKAFKKIHYEVYGRVIGENFLKIILTLIFIYLGLDIIGAAIAYTISIFASFAFLLYLLHKKTFPILSKKIKAIYTNKKLLIYSLPLVFNALTIMLVAWADSLMLGYFINIPTVGVYNVADPVAKLILLFPTAFAALYLPLIAEVHKERLEFKKVYYTTTKWVMIINTMALTWIIFYGKDLITFFFTETYIAATGPMTILIIGYFINGSIYTSRDILLLKDKTKLILKATIIAGISNILLNLILIPYYGMYGAAIATATSLTILSLIFLYHTYKGTRLNPYKNKTFQIIILTLISAITTNFLTKQLPLSPLYTILVSITLLPTINCLLIHFTKILNHEDKEMIRTILKKIRRTILWKA